ncbi:MAG: hypothetical protein AB7O62_18965 [Pirellulales bacterium]
MSARCLRGLSSAFLFVAAAMASAWARADVDSGPAVGRETPALQVLGVVGDGAGETVDFAARRVGKPTVIVFVPADKWTRPAARLLKEIDGRATEANPDAAVVAVWLTTDAAKSKTYLPIAQNSLGFARTALCVDEKNAAGPLEWNVNTAAEMTVVVVAGGKVHARWGFVSPNDTVAKDVLAALKAAK